MKTASAGLINHLAQNNQYMTADLYSFTLLSGIVLRLTTWPDDLIVGGFTFTSAKPFVSRGACTLKLGLEVPVLAVTILGGADVLIGGVPIMQAIQQGQFDLAVVNVDRVYMPSVGDVSLGTVNVFSGYVSDQDVGRISAVLNCVADTDQFNRMLPRNIIQAPCRHTLFGPGCELVAATFAVNSSALSGSTQVKINTALANADGYFDLGKIVGTSGTNLGFSRTVRAYLSSSFFLNIAFPYAVNIGDTFQAFPGCDHLQATCVGKFNNLVHFGGQPFVPPPEAAI